MKLEKVSYVLLPIILFCSNIKAQNSALYTSVKDTLSRNIDENPQMNIAYVAKLLDSQKWQLLNCYEKGKIWHFSGVSLYFLDREKEAIEDFNRALDIWGRCQDIPIEEIANTTYNIAIAYQYTEDIIKAKSFLNRALTFLESTEYDTWDLGLKYEGAGSYFFDVGDYENAKLNYEKALSIFNNTEGAQNKIIDLLNHILLLNIDFENYLEAKAKYDQINKIINQEKLSIPTEDRALLAINGARVLIEVGNLDEGKNVGQKANQLTSTLDDAYLYSISLELLGYIAMQQKHLDSAFAYFEKVLEIRFELGNSEYVRIATANAYENLADFYSKSGNLTLAKVNIRQAFEEIAQTAKLDDNGCPVIAESYFGNVPGVIRLLDQMARIYQDEYFQSSEFKFLDQSIDIYKKIDSLSINMVSGFQKEISKITIYKIIQDYYGGGIKASLMAYDATNDHKYLESAYFFSAQSKALVLRDQFKDKYSIDSLASENEIERYSQYISKINDIEKLLGQNDQNLDSLLSEYLYNQRELEILQVEVKSRKPADSSHIPRGVINTLSGLQRNIHKGTVLIEYFDADTILYSWWVTKNEIGFDQQQYTSEIKKDLHLFNEAVRDPSLIYPVEKGSNLFDFLFPVNLREILYNNDLLIIIPDGGLNSLPFEALTTEITDPESFLIYDCAISYSYTNADLFDITEYSYSTYTGFGTNYSSSLNADLKKTGLVSGNLNLPRFGLAEREISDVATLYRGKGFISSDASITNLLPVLKTSDVIHLSLHGLVNHENPRLSNIIFDSRNNPFIFTASDLDGLNCEAELLVLSSCSSADGKIYKGEGVHGMSRAFINAGSKKIISSLWNASESTSFRVITTFFEYLVQNKNVAHSMRISKIDYIKAAPPSQKHPYYWSNYIIIGDASPVAGGYIWMKHVAWITSFVALILVIIVYIKRS